MADQQQQPHVVQQLVAAADQLAGSVREFPAAWVVLTVVVGYFLAVLPVVVSLFADVVRYTWTLLSFLSGTGLGEGPCFRGASPADRHARVHVYSLALIFFLWDKPHYRNGTFQVDMLKNLRDVAVPGTGVSLKWFCYSQVTALAYLLLLYPVVCFIASLNAWRKRLWCPTEDAPYQTLAAAFHEQLLTPQDWFAFWRLNCRLATLHSYGLSTAGGGEPALQPVEGDAKHGYEVECKWTFLQRCQRLGVAHTPWLECDAVVCKNRNEEGGLGFMSFKNACVGGDWIIQEKLANSSELDALLPPNAPLSTFRVITGSWGGLTPRFNVAAKKEYDQEHPAFVFSTVFRAGLSGAATDHKSILFNVDPNTGEVKRGTTNAHWYRLGLHNVATCPWTSEHNFSRHPDKDPAAPPVEGQTVARIDEVRRLCVDAHERLCPQVPLCGWDVAFTKDNGMLLLEVNLSCNFFRGDFDQELYFEFVESYFKGLDDLRRSR